MYSTEEARKEASSRIANMPPACCSQAPAFLACGWSSLASGCCPLALRRVLPSRARMEDDSQRKGQQAKHTAWPIPTLPPSLELAPVEFATLRTAPPHRCIHDADV